MPMRELFALMRFHDNHIFVVGRAVSDFCGPFAEFAESQTEYLFEPVQNKSTNSPLQLNGCFLVSFPYDHMLSSFSFEIQV